MANTARENDLCLPPSPVTWWTFCCSTSLFCIPVSPAVICAWEGLFLSISPLYLQVRNTRSWNPTHLWHMKMLLNESLSKTLITQLDFWLVLEVQLQEEVENCSTEENLWFKRKGNLLSKCLKSGCAFGWGCGGLSNQVWKTIPSSLNFLIQPSEMLPYCHWKGQLKNVQ